MANIRNLKPTVKSLAKSKGQYDPYNPLETQAELYGLTPTDTELEQWAIPKAMEYTIHLALSELALKTENQLHNHVSFVQEAFNQLNTQSTRTREDYLFYLYQLITRTAELRRYADNEALQLKKAWDSWIQTPLEEYLEDPDKIRNQPEGED